MEPSIPNLSAFSLLYVEDDPIAREWVINIISKIFPAVVLRSAENGEMGLAMFQEHAPDIVLTDICMPVMDGLAMARHIRELKPATKIIATTALSDTHYLLGAIKIGISRYVLKPIDIDLLSEALNDCLAGMVLERQVAAHHDYVRRMNDELERQVRERTVELEASNRELEAFCYTVAHDLSTPLRGMSCFSSILLEDYSDKLDEVGKGHLLRIVSASVRMGRLITDLLELSRITRLRLRRQTVDLSALARQTVDALRRQEPGRRMEIALAEGVEADGDPVLLRLLLENLLGNAWKYTSREPGARIEFGSCSLRGETVYFIRDNGIGFDMAYAPKIFLPFERLHGVEEFAGNGIGLATVQRIVARHGGRVWADAQEGKGAVFYFTLGSPAPGSPTKRINDEMVAGTSPG